MAQKDYFDSFILATITIYSGVNPIYGVWS